MPQMSPMLWLVLYIYFLLLILLVMILLFYFLKTFNISTEFKLLKMNNFKFLW